MWIFCTRHATVVFVWYSARAVFIRPELWSPFGHSENKTFAIANICAHFIYSFCCCYCLCFEFHNSTYTMNNKELLLGEPWVCECGCESFYVDCQSSIHLEKKNRPKEIEKDLSGSESTSRQWNGATMIGVQDFSGKNSGAYIVKPLWIHEFRII